MEEIAVNPIRRLREALNITQEALADAIGVSRKHISDLESGNGKLDQKLLKALKKAGIDMNKFMDDYLEFLEQLKDSKE